jgi:hypothetical protein
MATYQTTYGTRPAKGLPGQVANSELVNVVSRTVESAAGIEFGQPAFRGAGDHGVVAGAAFAATGVGAAGVPAPAAATITASPVISGGAKAGTYTIRCIIGGAGTASKWAIIDPDGKQVGVATGNTEYDANGLKFTVTDAGTDPVVGETFTIAVTPTANVDFIGLAVLHPAVPAQNSTPDRFPQYFTGGFMTHGQMYVTAGASVVDGGDVYWNPATKRFTSTTSHIRIPNAEFDTSGGDGDIVEISLKSR